MDEVWGRFERVAPPCGFCSRMETASSSVGLLLAILGAGAAEGAYTLAFWNLADRQTLGVVWGGVCVTRLWPSVLTHVSKFNCSNPRTLSPHKLLRSKL